MNITNIEPLHREQGAYRNWTFHWRNQWMYSWRYWTNDKHLASGGNGNRPRNRNKK